MTETTKPTPAVNYLWQHDTWRTPHAITKVNGAGSFGTTVEFYDTPRFFAVSEEMVSDAAWKCVGYQLPDGRRVMVGEKRQVRPETVGTIERMLDAKRVFMRFKDSSASDYSIQHVASWPLVETETKGSRVEPAAHATLVRERDVASAKPDKSIAPGRSQIWREKNIGVFTLGMPMISDPSSFEMLETGGVIAMKQLIADGAECVGYQLPDGQRMMVGEHWTYVVCVPPGDPGSPAHVHLLEVINHYGPAFRVQYGETGGGCIGFIELTDLGEEDAYGACVRFARVGPSPSMLRPSTEVFREYAEVRFMPVCSLPASNSFTKTVTAPTSASLDAMLDTTRKAGITVDNKHVEKLARCARIAEEHEAVTRLSPEHARRHPAFADARLATLVAMDTSVSIAGSVLGWLLEYEDKRGGRRAPSTVAVAYARANFGEDAMAAYERGRGTPVEGLGILAEERIAAMGAMRTPDSALEHRAAWRAGVRREFREIRERLSKHDDSEGTGFDLDAWSLP